MNVGTMSLLTTCLVVLVICGGCCIGSSTVFSFAAKTQQFSTYNSSSTHYKKIQLLLVSICIKNQLNLTLWNESTVHLFLFNRFPGYLHILV